jgi:citrate lyase subunit beta/citryl-CoA lyase
MSGGDHVPHAGIAWADLRSLLFVPATAPARLLDRASERGADALIVDLEDGVALERKAAARQMLGAVVGALAERGAIVLLRVNADPAQWALDLAAAPLPRLAALMLPKVESPAAVEALARAANAAGADGLPVAALVESPAGVLAAATIAAHGRVCALGFGAEDHAAALGVAPTPLALAWPAAQVVHAAHAQGRACWGLAASIAEFGDLARFEAAVRDARAMGFTGSVCIHPRQVPVLNAGFAPTADERAWAQRVVAADRLARAAGQGVTQVDGHMVDRPIVERAKRWLAAERQRGVGLGSAD